MQIRGPGKKTKDNLTTEGAEDTEKIKLPSSVPSVPSVVKFFSLSVFFPLSVVHLFISRVETHSP
jgi:hypothetical protein